MIQVGRLLDRGALESGQGLFTRAGASENPCVAPLERTQGGRGHRTSQRTPADSPLFSSPACLSSTPPSIRGSQVPAERGQAKAGREESETGATDAPPAGPPKLLNYRDEQEAGSRQTLGDPGQAFCRSGGFSCFPMSCVTSSKSQWFSGPRFAPFAMGTASRRSYWAVFP